MKTAIMVALGAALFVTPALASRQATQTPGIVDAAAVAPYPMAQFAGAVRLRAGHRYRVKEARHESGRRQERGGAPARTSPADDQPRPAPSLPAGQERAQAGRLGALLGFPDGWEEGMSAPKPIIVGRRPARLEGSLTVAGLTFSFVSGGGGWSIPWGDYEISPNSEGSWGSRHDALDLTGVDRGDIVDHQLGRHRYGIEMHAGSNTLGCVALDNWTKAKRLIVGMISQSGSAFLHVWPGMASVTPTRSTGRMIVAIASPKVEKEEPVVRHRYADRRRRYRHYASR